MKSSGKTNVKKRAAPSNMPDSVSQIFKEYVMDKKLARLHRTTTSDDKNSSLIEFFANMGKTTATFPPFWQATVKSKVFQIVNSIELQLLAETSVPIRNPLQSETFVQNHSSTYPSNNSIRSQSTSYSQQLPHNSLVPSPRYYSTYESQLPPQPHFNENVQRIQTVPSENREPSLTSGYYATLGSQLSTQLHSNENVQYTQIVPTENREPSPSCFEENSIEN